MGESQQFPRLGVSACVWRDGRVLMIQRAKPPVGLWSLPGGHVEPGEATLAAAHRELAEETGIEADLGELIGLYDVIRRGSAGQVLMHYAVACYLGLWRAGVPRAGGDALSASWVDPDSLAGLALAPNVGNAVARARTLLKL